MARNEVGQPIDDASCPAIMGDAPTNGIERRGRTRLLI